MRKFWPVVFAVMAAFYFGRTFFENRWSEWAFADAQTMLAIQHVQNDGFLKNHFLWIPQSYTNFQHLFDTPELNHHANGVPTNGRRYRIYTHYPSWYSLPYTSLAYIGLDNKTLFQMIAVLLSLVGLFFLHRVWRSYFSDDLANLATALTLAGPIYLNYADSINTMPCEFFFRFGFMWLWISRPPRRLLLAWLFFFVASFTSIESYLFIPIWMALHEVIIERKKVPIFQLAILGLAPLASIALQFWQNASYFGSAQIALEDWISVATANNGNADVASGGRWLALIQPIQALLHYNSLVPIAMLALFAGIAWRLRPQYLKPLLVLLLPGFAFGMVFPRKAGFEYHGLEMIPSLMMVYAISLQYLWLNRTSRRNWIRRPALAAFVVLLALCLNRTYIVGIGKRIDIPPKTHAQSEVMQFARSLPSSNQKTVFFQLGKFVPLLDGGLPNQIEPMHEYVLGGMILSFDTIEQLERDFQYLMDRGLREYRPVILLPKDMKLQLGLSSAVPMNGPNGSTAWIGTF